MFASKEVQREVLLAYEAAFKETPILLRYPANSEHPTLEANVDRPFGFHDDSFAWGTLDTGKPDDSWFFIPALREAGALDRWQQVPIGGEIRPEAWGKVFDLGGNQGAQVEDDENRVQDFRECVQQTHATWLMDSGLFERRPSPERKQRAIEQVRELGYSLHAPWFSLDQQGQQCQLEVAIENRGVAPFYRPWSAEFGLLDEQGKVVHVFAAAGSIQGIMPKAGPRVWKESLDWSQVKSGDYTLALRVPNPLAVGGKPLRFANRSQDADAEGWLTLKRMSIR